MELARPHHCCSDLPLASTMLLPVARLKSYRLPSFKWTPQMRCDLSARSAVIAAKRTMIEGIGVELNAIASQNMDYAPARRRVREVFADIQQHLPHLLFKGTANGIRMEESYEMNSSRVEIFCKKWLPSSEIPIKGIVCFCHGYGDTCTFFFEGIAKRIASCGYGVYALDYPGFGLSEGLHGYIPSFDALVDDVIEHYTRVRLSSEASGVPHFLFGQSMGGAVALKVHLKQLYEWDGVVLVAPMCRISENMQPPKALQNILILMSNTLPAAKLVPQRDLAELAFRDRDKRKLTSYNVIAYSGRTRLKTAVELLKATKEIESQVKKVHAPLLVLHGAADKVTDPTVSKFLFEKASSEDKTLKLYEGGYHSILEGESDERILQVLSDIVTWLDLHCR